ncbi:hypothetical protein J4573_23610 [Actinomadura barringtoniae]|uniref:Uncharacterized protein n=1 Tax=Actinomadura barringtoniae TaxID=1427535 RepID=A0A939PCK0_9ACTN|nr:hypothetical protein [Actinomadura barringtoniae]MBO2450110.1 hypothetical protein [Actinomadura barringtoniae]
MQGLVVQGLVVRVVGRTVVFDVPPMAQHRVVMGDLVDDAQMRMRVVPPVVVMPDVVSVTCVVMASVVVAAVPVCGGSASRLGVAADLAAAHRDGWANRQTGGRAAGIGVCDACGEDHPSARRQGRADGPTRPASLKESGRD